MKIEGKLCPVMSRPVLQPHQNQPSIMIVELFLVTCTSDCAAFRETGYLTLDKEWVSYGQHCNMMRRNKE